MKSLEFAFEINWPLAHHRKTYDQNLFAKQLCSLFRGFQQKTPCGYAIQPKCPSYQTPDQTNKNTCLTFGARKFSRLVIYQTYQNRETLWYNEPRRALVLENGLETKPRHKVIPQFNCHGNFPSGFLMRKSWLTAHQSISYF